MNYISLFYLSFYFYRRLKIIIMSCKMCKFLLNMTMFVHTRLVEVKLHHVFI
ncbi:unnamed protein product [Brassica napus]|uniref:(rape) hypothetical protein n=1 Tax=Brassica napus TaxID=3708 RepID=A0A816UT05_BRANA|nr:unnamed protein product [Brassica napus]